jgi:SH3-like domain-containing protein
MIKFIFSFIIFYSFFGESRAFSDKHQFVYIKSNNVNLRNGPGQNYRAIANYTKMFMPFEVVYKVNEWYMLKAYDGNIGWIKSNMIGAKNRYIIAKNDSILCFNHTNDKCKNIVTFVKKESIGRLKKCSNKKCRVIFNGKYSGWIDYQDIFGVNHFDLGLVGK